MIEDVDANKGAPTLDAQERQLAEELAYLVACRMQSHLEILDGKVYNFGTSNYEAACTALNLVSVYETFGHYTVYSVVVPTEKVRQHMKTLPSISRQALEELIYAFLINYCDFNQPRLEPTLGGFFVPEALLRAVKLLANCGYAHQSCDQYVWDKKIYPYLHRCYFFDEDGKLFPKTQEDSPY